MKKGQIIVVSGPSGVGKGTVIKRLMADNANYKLSVSATTRERRPSETEGVEYYFVSQERFLQMIEENALVEYARYANHYYGTPCYSLDSLRNQGYDVFVEIEVQGALQIKNSIPEAVLIFIVAPSFSELRRRLTGRGDTPIETAELRLRIAKEEYQAAKAYDYIVLNDTVESACEQIQAIITASKCRTENRSELLKEDE